MLTMTIFLDMKNYVHLQVKLVYDCIEVIGDYSGLAELANELLELYEDAKKWEDEWGAAVSLAEISMDRGIWTIDDSLSLGIYCKGTEKE